MSLSLPPISFLRAICRLSEGTAQTSQDRCRLPTPQFRQASCTPHLSWPATANKNKSQTHQTCVIGEKRKRKHNNAKHVQHSLHEVVLVVSQNGTPSSPPKQRSEHMKRKTLLVAPGAQLGGRSFGSTSFSALWSFSFAGSMHLVWKAPEVLSH